MGSLGLSWASLKLSGTLWEFSWGSLGLLWPPLGPSWAPLGLPWGCLVALLGPLGPPLGPLGPLLGLAWALQERDPKMDPFWVPLGSIFVGVLDSSLVPCWFQFWFPFWVSLWGRFLELPWAHLWPISCQKEGPRRTRRALEGHFCCYLRRFWHVAPFAVFKRLGALLRPLGASVAMFAPFRVPFWNPK